MLSVSVLRRSSSSSTYFQIASCSSSGSWSESRRGSCARAVDRGGHIPRDRVGHGLDEHGVLAGRPTQGDPEAAARAEEVDKATAHQLVDLILHLLELLCLDPSGHVPIVGDGRVLLFRTRRYTARMKAKPSRLRTRILIIGGALVAAGLVVGLILFQPWLLFIDVKVDEKLPSVAAPVTPDPTASATPDPVPVELSTGTFVSQEHTTTGTVRIIENPDGTRVLALENLDTSNGPDVHVWLSAADAVEGFDGWFLAGGAAHFDLGPIKGNQGNQVYDIPAEVDLAAYRSVSLWCVQFSVGFGAAQLS